MWQSPPQVFLVTGGYDGGLTSGLPSDLDSTELYDSSVGKWAMAGAKLKNRMAGMRATNIDDRILIFGKDYIVDIINTKVTLYLKVVAHLAVK